MKEAVPSRGTPGVPSGQQLTPLALRLAERARVGEWYKTGGSVLPEGDFNCSPLGSRNTNTGSFGRSTSK